MYKIRTTIDDKTTAQTLGRNLVESHVAVSVHIREIESIYAWEDRVHNITEYEIEALCSNTTDAYDLIQKQHPYKLPEFFSEDISCPDTIEKWCSDWCNKKSEKM